jgi:GNAT superfamily N-acetyltransferase
LARLAERCGAEDVNILALQIFPGVEAVTDELVLSTPDFWGVVEVAAMIEAAGGRQVGVSACTAHALVDGPTNYLLAVRHVVDDPGSVHEALTELLDGETGHDELTPVLATLEVAVAGQVVTVRRGAAFTVTEEARAQAFASVVDELLSREEPERFAPPVADGEPVFRLATAGDAMALVRMAQRCSAQTLSGRFGVPLSALQPRMARRLLAEGPALVVQVGHEVVGLATVTPGEPAETSLIVEDGWQGRGVGTRLLGLAARLAKARGAEELVLRSEHNNDAVPRLSAASGLTGRVRHDNGRIILTVSLRRVAPLLQNVEGALGPRPLDPAPA